MHLLNRVLTVQFRNPAQRYLEERVVIAGFLPFNVKAHQCVRGGNASHRRRCIACAAMKGLLARSTCRPSEDALGFLLYFSSFDFDYFRFYLIVVEASFKA